MFFPKKPKICIPFLYCWSLSQSHYEDFPPSLAWLFNHLQVFTWVLSCLINTGPGAKCRALGPIPPGNVWIKWKFYLMLNVSKLQLSVPLCGKILNLDSNQELSWGIGSCIFIQLLQLESNSPPHWSLNCTVEANHRFQPSLQTRIHKRLKCKAQLAHTEFNVLVDEESQ